jgi:hypothetical protein
MGNGHSNWLGLLVSLQWWHGAVMLCIVLCDDSLLFPLMQLGRNMAG